MEEITIREAEFVIACLREDYLGKVFRQMSNASDSLPSRSIEEAELAWRIAEQEVVIAEARLRIARKEHHDDPEENTC